MNMNLVQNMPHQQKSNKRMKATNKLKKNQNIIDHYFEAASKDKAE